MLRYASEVGKASMAANGNGASKLLAMRLSVSLRLRIGDMSELIGLSKLQDTAKLSLFDHFWMLLDMILVQNALGCRVSTRLLASEAALGWFKMV